jgi:hypothetical protein
MGFNMIKNIMDSRSGIEEKKYMAAHDNELKKQGVKMNSR